MCALYKHKNLIVPLHCNLGLLMMRSSFSLSSLFLTSLLLLRYYSLSPIFLFLILIIHYSLFINWWVMYTFFFINSLITEYNISDFEFRSINLEHKSYFLLAWEKQSMRAHHQGVGTHTIHSAGPFPNKNSFKTPNSSLIASIVTDIM